MRLSVRENDPGYDERAMGCTILVDGVDVTRRCHTADEEEGKAWCFKHNERDRPFVDNSRKVVEEVLTGKVVIVLRSDEINGHDAHPSH